MLNVNFVYMRDKSKRIPVINFNYEFQFEKEEEFLFVPADFIEQIE